MTTASGRLRDGVTFAADGGIAGAMRTAAMPPLRPMVARIGVDPTFMGEGGHALVMPRRLLRPDRGVHAHPRAGTP